MDEIEHIFRQLLTLPEQAFLGMIVLFLCLIWLDMPNKKDFR
jgi:hypothetical protein